MPRKEGDWPVYDATGSMDADICPRCGSDATITYHYEEGFEELECSACGFVSDAAEIAALQRYSGDILLDGSAEEQPVPLPGKRITA